MRDVSCCYGDDHLKEGNHYNRKCVLRFGAVVIHSF